MLKRRNVLLSIVVSIAVLVIANQVFLLAWPGVWYALPVNLTVVVWTVLMPIDAFVLLLMWRDLRVLKKKTRVLKAEIAVRQEELRALKAEAARRCAEAEDTQSFVRRLRREVLGE